MFDCVTCTWNPLGGECPHNCSYCWAKQLAKRHSMKKYQGQPRLIEKEMWKTFKQDSFVFVQDMSDLFANTVKQELIRRVINHIYEFPWATFLFLTKNPKRYKQFERLFKPNMICGVTIESDVDYGETLAPEPLIRFFDFNQLKCVRKMVSIEPIMEFSDCFIDRLARVKPEFVYVGYDNYNNNLPEPSIEKVDQLISKLREFTEVREKPSIQKRREQNEQT